MANLLKGMAGDDADGEGGGDELQARVRQNLANMMRQHGGGADAEGIDEFVRRKTVTTAPPGFSTQSYAGAGG